jgi:hypothetical protein
MENEIMVVQTPTTLISQAIEKGLDVASLQSPSLALRV